MSAPTSSLPQQPRVRRNNAGSPCRLHPIRAIVPYQLLLGGPSCPALSPSLSAGGNSGPTTSGGGSSSPSPTLSCGAHGIWEPKFPTRQRLSPENKGCRSPDWGPNSPVCRGERSKPQVRSSSAIRRTSSLDAITGPYLTGQWPRDFHEPCMKDKATQTHGIWVEDTGGEQGRPHQRSASWGSADHLKEIVKLRLQLQRNKQINRQSKDREQPVQHISTTCQPPTKVVPVFLSNVPVPKSLMSRVPSSMDGINYELENVFITEDWKQEIQPLEVLDGRRAPFQPYRYGNGSDTRDTDTQTPSSGGPCTSEPLPSPEGSPCFTDELDKDGRCSSPLLMFATSPKPNNSYMFKREPPEGCERVKVFEEMVSGTSKGFPLFSCPDKSKVNFITRGTAFCPVKLLCSSIYSSTSSSSPGLHGSTWPDATLAPTTSHTSSDWGLSVVTRSDPSRENRTDSHSPDTGPNIETDQLTSTAVISDGRSSDPCSTTHVLLTS